MPQVFKIGSYLVYFWINEGMPLEPIHVHVAEGTPQANGTKIWITKTGGTLLANNTSKIPERKLQIIMDVIEARHADVEALWVKKFGVIDYYC
ncbi:MAG: DUF4160 domain-containing protein [Bilifractor sp.]